MMSSISRPILALSQLGLLVILTLKPPVIHTKENEREKTSLGTTWLVVVVLLFLIPLSLQTFVY